MLVDGGARGKEGREEEKEDTVEDKVAVYKEDSGKGAGGMMKGE